MLRKEKKYFRYVVKKKNLLIFGDYNLVHFNELFKKFNNFYYMQETEFTLDNLNTFIVDNEIDVVISTSMNNSEKISELLSVIRESYDLHLFALLNIKNIFNFESIINISDSVFTQSVSTDQLEYKIYSCLSDITDRSYSIPILSSKKEELYKDAFELDVIHLSEDFLQISNSLDNGDVSDELFVRLKADVTKVIYILESHMMHSDAIKQLFNDFNQFLENFSVSQLGLESLDGFDYLARLIEDIASFLEKYFVSREFDDIYVVEDSLENSMKFMKDAFSRDMSIDDGSDLEFFDD